MILKIQNLGAIKEAEINLNKNLILFTGLNNTGKTYLSYLIYGLYKLPYGRIHKQFFPLIDVEDVDDNAICIQFDMNKFFDEKLNQVKSIYEKLLVEYCPTIFASQKIQPKVEIQFTYDDIQGFLDLCSIMQLKNNDFSVGYKDINLYDDKGVFEIEKGIITIRFDRINNTNANYNQFKEKVKDVIRLNIYIQFEEVLKQTASFNHIYQRDYNSIVYFFPSERATLNQYATDIVSKTFSDYQESYNAYPFETKDNPKIQISDYPKPINDYIKFVLSLKNKLKQSSDLAPIAEEYEKKILQGKVIIDNYGAVQLQVEDKIMDIQETSSTVKSLSGLVVYLRHIAQKNDIVFIDEPEMNLHPDNQRIFARIIAKVVNAGVKVILSTHSDYITKELSTLVLLGRDKSNFETYKKEYGYTEAEILDETNVGVYSLTPGSKVEETEIDEYGIEIDSFDEQIDEQSKIFNRIYFDTSKGL